MVRRMLKRPSAAGIVAVLALVLAMGGTATAAKLISGKDIQNKSLTGKDVKGKSLGAGKLKLNSLGGDQIDESKLGKVPAAATADTATNATNAANATTATTATSATDAAAIGGVPAAAVVRNVEYVEGSSIGNDTAKQAFAQCPAGKQVIGGTAAINGGNTGDVFLQRSQSANGHSQWFAQARVAGAGHAGWDVSATAICANVD
jgi:hypothetical protein